MPKRLRVFWRARSQGHYSLRIGEQHREIRIVEDEETAVDVER